MLQELAEIKGSNPFGRIYTRTWPNWGALKIPGTSQGLAGNGTYTVYPPGVRVDVGACAKKKCVLHITLSRACHGFCVQVVRACSRH
jgi:hypothetical protein